MDPEKLEEAFEWLVCYYLDKTQKRFEDLKSQGLDDWHGRNDSQMFFARTLALVYGEVDDAFFHIRLIIPVSC